MPDPYSPPSQYNIHDEVLNALEAGLNPSEVLAQLKKKYAQEAIFRDSPEMRNLAGSDAGYRDSPQRFQSPIRIAPDQRLAQPFQAPSPVAAPGTMSEEQRKKVYDHVMSTYQGQPGVVGPGAEEAMAASPPARISPDDYATRFRQASERERGSMVGLGISRDIARSMSTALNTGAHIRSHTPPPQFGSGAAEGRLAAAQVEKQDLGQGEDIDPQSVRSQHTREFLKSMLPELVAKIPSFDTLSHQQVMQYMPFAEKAADRSWQDEQKGIDRKFKEKQFESLDAARDERLSMTRQREGRLSQDAEKRVNDIDNVLGELGELEKSSNDPSLGPVSGRWMKFKARLGLTDSKEAQLLSNINFHSLTLLKAMGGVRGAASPELHKAMQGLTPEAFNSPEAFQGIINAVRTQMQNDRMNTLKTQAGQGRANVQNFLPSGYSMNRNEAGGYDISGGAPSPPAAEPVGTPAGKVKVEKDGKFFWLPQEQLQEAEAQGYKRTP